MTRGCIFDIKEFALNDGPGIRLTIFLKGCPLHCKWCHNPEGISFDPELNLKTNQFVGNFWEASELARKINSFKDVFDISKGGVTFSGGEPLSQFKFLLEVCQELAPDIHKTIETSGQCSSETFIKVVNCFDLVFFDLKIINSSMHKKYTGADNKQILTNLFELSKMEIPYHIRIPLIPNITDTKENLKHIEMMLKGLPNKPKQIDMLSYNRFAGGKYPVFGKKFPLKHIENLNQSIYVQDFILNSKEFNVVLFQ